MVLLKGSDCISTRSITPVNSNSSGLNAYQQGKSKGFASCDWVIWLKLYSNRRFFSPCNLKIWWMISTNNRTPLLHYIKLCASFQIHQWIQTGVTILKPSIRVKIGDFFAPCDLEISWMTVDNNRASLLYYAKLCALFQRHGWIQTGITVRKH